MPIKRTDRPGDCSPGKHGYRWRRNTPAGTFASKGRYSQWVHQKESRLFPDLGDQVIQIIRSWRTVAGFDMLRRRDAVQQAVIFIINEFAFLAFLYNFYGQAQLLADLVIRFAVQI